MERHIAARILAEEGRFKILFVANKADNNSLSEVDNNLVVNP
jgi:hypothetical protein